jgi:putative membrane protein
MIVRKTLDPIIIARNAWRRVLSLIIVSTLVSWWWSRGYDHVSIDSIPATVLGIALSILVGFRVNSAYDRWWEARRLWGAITNDSRTTARQLTTFLWYRNPAKGGAGVDCDERDRYVREMVYRQIAFVYALKNHLRRLDPWDEIQPFLSKKEFENLKRQKHVPNALLQSQAVCLQEIDEKEFVTDFRHVQIETRLTALCDSMGGCERIKNTVFPRQYSVYSTLFISVYTHLLPFVFVSKIGWVTIPVTLVIGFIFFALDRIATNIENPFENKIDDTPMSSICRTIEINLRQQLGETELPEPVQSVDGFLY